MKPKKHLILSVFICLVFQAQTVTTQEIHRMDLQTAISVAKLQSNQMQLLRERLNKASFDLQATTRQYRTHIDLDLTMPQYTETIRQWEDSLGISFYPVRQNMLSSYLSVSQLLPTDGRLFIRTGLQNYTDYYANDRNAQIMGSIGLSQPIEAFFGVNNFQLALKQARLGYEMVLKQLKRSELDLVYLVSQAFYNVLSAREAMNISQMNLERQEEAYHIAQNKFTAGLLREVEALQMEVDFSAASNQFENAKTDFAAQMRDFKEQIGIPFTDSVVIENKLDYQPVSVDVEKAIELAMANRLELKENRIQIELQEMAIKRQKAAGRISGDILLNYNFIGVDKSDRAIPIGDSFENTWNNMSSRPGSFGIGLTASVPILDWGENRARIQAAESILKQERLQQEGTELAIEREIRTLVDRLNNSLRGLTMMEKSLVVARKSFDISRTRYANGEIDSQSMALERERLTQAYTTHLQSYISYKLTLSDLMRKTFFDFETNLAVDEN